MRQVASEGVALTLGRRWALFLIRGYQRVISPFKGYRCAFHAHTGNASCSALGYRVIRRFGVWQGVVLLRRRLYLCGVAYRRYAPVHRRPWIQQRGDCDLGCDIGDLPSGKSMLRLCECLNYGDCMSCDWPRRGKRQDRKRERDIRLPRERAFTGLVG
jgi:uncharacterized protein